jgi:hypothetical protein
LLFLPITSKPIMVIAAVFALFPVEKCILLFASFNFSEAMYVFLLYLRFILRRRQGNFVE